MTAMRMGPSALALAILLALASQAGARSAARSGGEIVFVRDTQNAAGSYSAEEIWAVNPDGTGLRNVSRNPAPDLEPAWSPDGRKIAFASYRCPPTAATCDTNVFVMNADGTGQRRLTRARGDGEPAWSPDGTRIAFHRQAGGSIWIMKANGSGQRLLARNADFPAWSPDGRQILFMRGSGSTQGPLYAMNADGTAQHRLISVQGKAPGWSPDGRTIAFEGDLPNGGPGGIYLADADGTHVRRLTRQPSDQSPAWSPDGTMLVFVRQVRYPQLYVMNADGSNIHRIVPAPGRQDRFEDWTPDWSRVP